MLTPRFSPNGVFGRRWSGLWAAAFACGLLLWIVFTAGPELAEAGKYKYPKAKVKDVSDNYHGTIVKDPYRWLEDPESEETLEWVGKQNELTRKYIDSYPDREKIKEWYTKIWNYPRYSLPEKKGGRYFFSKNDGLQNQSVLYVQESLGGEAEVVIDPNTLSEDGTVALNSREFSDDGTLLAYGLSQSGSDWQTIHIRSVETGKDYDEVLRWCKFSSIAWMPDNSGFYYNRFPGEGEVAEEDRNNFNKVYWHELGTPQSKDKLVFERPEEKELGFYPDITDDGNYLLLWVYHGTDPNNGIYYRKMDNDGEFVRFLEHGEAKYSPIDNVGSTMYVNTSLDASRGRIVAIDVDNPASENWKEIVPHGGDVLHFAVMVNDQLVVAYMHDAHHQVKIFDRDGSFVRDLDLPTIGSLSGLQGKREDTEMLYNFTSFVYPTTSFRYDFKEDKTEIFRESEIDFDPSNYTTTQVFYKSKDGTRVPMFLTHKKGLEKNGKNPAWLYGYGGFNVSMTPYFSLTRLLWLEMGGIYAVANIRGGDEYGEEWHQGGILDRKQNVFDDFIAAGKFLVSEKYTATPKLLISGASNGGLLVAACLLQRPDLFGAVVCQVPVTDMLRYQKFTVGRFWVSDFGNAEENPGHFKFLYEYSPLHNVKKGETYPPLLITSADTDDRVVPSHAKKFAAALQAADSGKNPLLLRVETKAGHGSGKPTTKIIEEISDTYSFVFKTFGMTCKDL
jgi:prolyl oligopeptidase